MTKAVDQQGAPLSSTELQDLVVESDTGARRPSGLSAKILIGVALAWSLFQLWIASPLPFVFGELLNIPILDGTKSRYVHLAFAVFLAYLAYPATKRSPNKYIPVLDWVYAIVAALSSLYLLFFYVELSKRTGLPTNQDIAVAAVGMVLLLEATRRALGPPLMVIAMIFLFYTFFGSMDFIPEVIRHKGQSINKVASHQWLTTEGVFGIAIGVSTSFVFLFVLFGALLDKSGAGNYFIKVAFSLLGHLSGGPAKAAVLSSAMTGVISGSSIANVVTTGTFTVPLMRRVGFTREQAGAVEVASSVNGQIMPPVMGAAAFLMVEYVGIPYIEVVKHAFLPAVISYIALLYMVHLEAKKKNMKVLEKPNKRPPIQGLMVFGITVSSIIILAGAVYYGIGWIKTLFGDTAAYIIATLLLTVYIGLLWYEAALPDLEMDDPNEPMKTLPETGPTVRTGIHYILPIIVLVWCLMVERLSPGLSAFYATAFMIFILVTQHPIKEFFRKSGKVITGLKLGLMDLFDGLVIGARNMVGIGVATAAAGIIVGSVSLTGVGQVLTELVEIISGGSIMLILIFTAIICLILGMGLPTTANYIVVASLMAKVIEDLGAQNGLIVPAIAIHLFVFYFGIMADVTPPVGLASFAAAAVSGGNPIKTGIQAFMYSLRTVILPFLFIFDTELLLIGVDTVAMATWVFIKATFAILLFSAAMQGYMIVRSKWYESVALLAVTLMLFAPQLWINFFVPPYVEKDVAKLEESVMQQVPGNMLKLHVAGVSFEGVKNDFEVFAPVSEGATTSERLNEYGLVLRQDGEKVIVDDIGFNSPAEKAFGDDFYDYDYEITAIEVAQEQPNKRWMNIPAVILFLIIVMLQRSRRNKISMATATA